MRIIEYRIPFPRTSLSEYRRGWTHTQIEIQKENSGGGEGVEVLKEEPQSVREAFPDQVELQKEVVEKINEMRRSRHSINDCDFQQLVDFDTKCGSYVRKVYHVYSRLPVFIKPFLNAKNCDLYEDSWTFFPFTLTKYENPGLMKNNMALNVISWHLTVGQCLRSHHKGSNVVGYDKAHLKKREILTIDIANNASFYPEGSGENKNDPICFNALETAPETLSTEDKSRLDTDPAFKLKYSDINFEKSRKTTPAKKQKSAGKQSKSPKKKDKEGGMNSTSSNGALASHVTDHVTDDPSHVTAGRSGSVGNVGMMKETEDELLCNGVGNVIRGKNVESAVFEGLQEVDKEDFRYNLPDWYQDELRQYIGSTSSSVDAPGQGNAQGINREGSFDLEQQLLVFKTVECKFKWLGLQTMAENAIVSFDLKLFHKLHTDIWNSWLKWREISWERMVQLEKESHQELLELMKSGTATKGQLTF